jgi:NADH dehydrogenase [ubiquinone] 1 alpha subcomplex assembly factor 7
VTEPTLAERLAQVIAEEGPISIAKYMGAANAHYYATRDPLGVAGDFTTAPEISQMFGELIGLWLADLWLRAGRPEVRYVELGPGRGTLAGDALRSMATVGLSPPVHFVETSPTMRAAQALSVPSALWHDHSSEIPQDRPWLVVANEFFDALPIHQLMRHGEGWHEREVTVEAGRFVPVVGKRLPDEIIPPDLRDADPGEMIETCPEGVATIRLLSQRIGAQSGAAVIIDYGYDGPDLGNTLQAVRGHRYAEPFEAPGEQDLTALIDFSTLQAMAEMCGVVVHPAMAQGDWLLRLGLAERAASLIEAQPDRADEIKAAQARLSDPQAMGRLFRVMSVTSPDWPKPAGFDPVAI